jgi:ABC-type molybdate transport system permease subunit
MLRVMLATPMSVSKTAIGIEKMGAEPVGVSSTAEAAPVALMLTVLAPLETRTISCPLLYEVIA